MLRGPTFGSKVANSVRSLWKGFKNMAGGAWDWIKNMWGKLTKLWSPSLVADDRTDTVMNPDDSSDSDTIERVIAHEKLVTPYRFVDSSERRSRSFSPVADRNSIEESSSFEKGGDVPRKRPPDNVHRIIYNTRHAR